MGGLGSRLGIIVFIVVLVLDQVTKQAALAYLPERQFVEVTPFFNLVLVWNSGVSFGMFQNDGTTGRWLLIGLAIAIGCVIAYLLRREARLLAIIAYWLVLSGAVGNVIDRSIYGAVIDFLDFHIKNYHWPAFNVADSAIVVGAGLLIYDSFSRPDDTEKR